MKVIVSKLICLLIIPLFIGICFWFIILPSCINFSDESNACIIVLGSIIITICSSYYLKEIKGYLFHDFLFLSSGAIFLLSFMDLLISGTSHFRTSLPRESLLLHLFQYETLLRSGGDELSYFLSTTTQCLAAIFAIVFSLTFICAQLYSRFYEPAQAKLIFRKPSTLVLVSAYIFFISYNLYLLSHISLCSEKNVLFGFLGSIFCFYWVFPYIMSIVIELDPKEIMRITLTEAKEENDNKKKEAVDRVLSNMEYWFQENKMKEFVLAYFELQNFLNDIQEKTDKETFNRLKGRVRDRYESCIRGNDRLRLMIMREITRKFRNQKQRRRENK